MDLSDKIGKALLFAGMGFVAWLVFTHYADAGLFPSADPLTSFFVFMAIGGAIYWVNRNRADTKEWLLRGTGRKILIGAGWVLTLTVLVTYKHDPAPAPFVLFTFVFLAYQTYRLVMWVLF